MTTAVAEAPPDVDQEQQREEAESVSIHHEVDGKPQGITKETWQRLKPKGKRFVRVYIDTGNVLKAYQDAGYVADKGTGSGIKHQRNAYSVLRGVKVHAALLEHADRRAVLEQDRDNCTRDYIRSELERLKRKAEDKHDYANAIRAVELEGRMFAYFSDAVQVDVAARREYSEAEEAEGRHLARLRLEEMGGQEQKQLQEATGRRPNGNDGETRPQGGKSTKTPDSAIGETPENTIGEIPYKNGKS